MAQEMATRATPMLTLQQVSEQLAVGYWTVWRLVRDGELPAAKVGAQWRVSHEALARYLARGANN